MIEWLVDFICWHCIVIVCLCSALIIRYFPSFANYPLPPKEYNPVYSPPIGEDYKYNLIKQKKGSFDIERTNQKGERSITRFMFFENAEDRPKPVKIPKKKK